MTLNNYIGLFYPLTHFFIHLQDLRWIWCEPVFSFVSRFLPCWSELSPCLFVCLSVCLFWVEKPFLFPRMIRLFLRFEPVMNHRNAAMFSTDPQCCFPFVLAALPALNIHTITLKVIQLWEWFTLEVLVANPFIQTNPNKDTRVFHKACFYHVWILD